MVPPGCGLQQRILGQSIFNAVNNSFSFIQILCEELDKCNIKLVELDAAVQDFAEQNPTLGKQLVDKIGKLIELQQQASKQAEYRAGKVKQVYTLCCYHSFLHTFSKEIK